MLHADGKVITPLFRAKPGDTRLDTSTDVHDHPDTHFPGVVRRIGETREVVRGLRLLLDDHRRVAPAEPARPDETTDG
jgi:hypothetical protein